MEPMNTSPPSSPPSPPAIVHPAPIKEVLKKEFVFPLNSNFTSDIIHCGGNPWQLKFLPQGESYGQSSLFLEWLSNESTEFSAVRFIITLSHPMNSISKTAQHRFCSQDKDWGYRRFVNTNQLESYANSEGQLSVTLELFVYNDETGVLFHNFNNYDSKVYTGYVGLKNQGATCYMNSLLQALFHLKQFRQTTFNIPTEGESDGVVSALQRVFYLLQTSNYPVGTTELTKSFGWDSYESFMQHDIQEFNRVLLDNLEEKIKKKGGDAAVIKDLFVGKMKSFIKCVGVPFESSRVEEFYDIQLNVKGFQSLQDSFVDYVQVEMLDGDNQYHADGHGMQDAKKGVIFEDFPPVLFLQLKRFEYDFTRDSMVKVNDVFSFPESIDLGDFCEKSGHWEYDLFAVLVHMGDVNAGHYNAFIKPPNSTWLKFDDDRVIKVTKTQVFEDNFGHDGHAVPRTTHQRVRMFTNAYMLVYVRRNAHSHIFPSTITPPAHLEEVIGKELVAKEEKWRKEQHEREHMQVKIIRDADMRNYSGFDHVDFDKVPSQEWHRQTCVDKLLKEVGARQFYMLLRRHNGTIRINQPLKDTEYNLTLDQLLNLYYRTSPTYDLVLYASNNSPDPNTVLLCIKSYSNNILSTVGTINVDVNQRVETCESKIKELVGYSDIEIFEEIKPSFIDRVDITKTFHEAELGDGDILTVQKLNDSVLDFYIDLADYVVLEFYPATFGEKEMKKVRVRLSSTLAEVVRDHFDTPSRVLIAYNGSSLQNLDVVLKSFYNPAGRFTFREMDYTIEEMEKCKLFVVDFDGKVRKALVPKDTTCAALMSELGDDVAVYDITGGTIHRIFDADTPVNMIYDRVTAQTVKAPFIKVYFFEKVPEAIHGKPFLFSLIDTEPIAETKKRLAERVDVKFSLALINETTKEAQRLNQNFVWKETWEGWFLGLDCSTKRGGADRSIKIFN